MDRRVWRGKDIFLLLGIFGGIFVAGASQAVERRTSAVEPGKFYFGVKGGLMMPDTGTLEDVINVGANLGYNFPKMNLPLNGTIAAEGEVTLSAMQGDVLGGGDWDLQTIGGYGVFRAGDAFYVKGKAGIAHQRFNIELAGVDANDKDTDISLGAGLGMRIQESRIEVEYTWFGDINFLSVGYLF